MFWIFVCFFIFLLIWIVIPKIQSVLRGNVSKDIKKVNLNQQIFCITGGNRGIGFETVKILLNWNGIVILGVRDVKLCQSTFDKILSSEEKERLIIAHLDLSSFESVHQFVEENFIKPKRKLNCLINNAHHSGLARMTSTRDSIEYSYQVNFVSHALLTLLLIPVLNASSNSPSSSSPSIPSSSLPSLTPSRIVHVGSRTYAFGKIRRDRYSFKNRGLFNYNPDQIYPDTKLMQLLFSKALTTYFQQNGYQISSNYVHPGGLVKTTNEWFRGNEYSVAMRFEPILMKFAGTDVVDAARAVVNAAILTPSVCHLQIAPNKVISVVEGGKYFDTTEEKEITATYEEFENDLTWLWKNTLEIIDLPLKDSLE